MCFKSILLIFFYSNFLLIPSYNTHISAPFMYFWKNGMLSKCKIEIRRASSSKNGTINFLELAWEYQFLESQVESGQQKFEKYGSLCKFWLVTSLFNATMENYNAVTFLVGQMDRKCWEKKIILVFKKTTHFPKKCP